MDLSKLSANELRKLHRRIDVELKKREEGKKRDLLKKMQRMAAEQGMSLAEVLGKSAPASRGAAPSAPKAKRKSKAKGVKVAPKYHNPDDTSMTWTGRGRKPLWVVKALGDGKSLEELLINAA